MIMIVKKIAKYLILLLLVVIATLSNVNEAESTTREMLPTEALTEFSTTSIDTTSDSGNITAPSYTVTPHTVHLTGTAKRSNNAHRNNFEILRLRTLRMATRATRQASTISTLSMNWSAWATL